MCGSQIIRYWLCQALLGCKNQIQIKVVPVDKDFSWGLRKTRSWLQWPHVEMCRKPGMLLRDAGALSAAAFFTGPAPPFLCRQNTLLPAPAALLVLCVIQKSFVSASNWDYSFWYHPCLSILLPLLLRFIFPLTWPLTMWYICQIKSSSSGGV